MSANEIVSALFSHKRKSIEALALGLVTVPPDLSPPRVTGLSPAQSGVFLML